MLCLNVRICEAVQPTVHSFLRGSNILWRIHRGEHVTSNEQRRCSSPSLALLFQKPAPFHETALNHGYLEKKNPDETLASFQHCLRRQLSLWDWVRAYYRTSVKRKHNTKGKGSGSMIISKNKTVTEEGCPGKLKTIY